MCKGMQANCALCMSGFVYIHKNIKEGRTIKRHFRFYKFLIVFTLLCLIQVQSAGGLENPADSRNEISSKWPSMLKIGRVHNNDNTQTVLVVEKLVTIYSS